MKGLIFDIKEFAINDGPGIRVTVFMKGCPLRCMWCHNPEGLSSSPQLNHKTGKMVGKEWEASDLVNKLNKFQDVFELSNGGVSFSGGEPTLQADFLYEVGEKLSNIHKTLDTSGYCDAKVFKRLLSVFNLVYFDLKLIDDQDHIKYTGVSNQKILENLKILDGSGLAYHIRIPLIPDITDTKKNLDSIKDIILGLKHKPLRVDPLPYNIYAGGKYQAYDMEYPLKGNENKGNNIDNIRVFKQELLGNNIKVIGEEVKCLQNVYKK